MTDLYEAPPEDLSSDYSKRAASSAFASDVAEMESFATAENTPTPAPVLFGQPVRPIQEKPLRRKTDDPLGRIPVEPEKAKSSVMRNVAEIPSSMKAGAESAISNALGWAIDPLANWLNDNVADLSYKIKDPNTPTGQITKGISEFLTGFIPVLKGFRAAGATGKVIPPLAAGVIADFAVHDPAQGRLSDLWVKLGLPKNVLTDYLSSKPDDTEFESRFKNALESAGLGLATEGVFLAARMIRHARALRETRKTEQQYLRDKYGSIDDETFNRILGDPTKPSVEMVVREPSKMGEKIKQGAVDTSGLDPQSILHSDELSRRLAAADKVAKGGKLTSEELKEFPQLADLQKAKEVIAEGRGGGGGGGGGGPPKLPPGGGEPPMPTGPRPEDFDVYINFSKFDEPDQIKFAIGKLADNAKGTIDEATRGKIAQRETQKLADNLGMTVPELLARRKGQGFNAEEAVAARQLWAASAERLVQLAKVSASKDASPLDEYAFRHMMAIHSAIQAEVIGARTETARALASWKILVKGGIERARAIDQVMNAIGGSPTAKEMARRLAILDEVGANPAAVAKFAQRGAGAASVDAVREIWINGLLSAPKTHVVNTLSNTMVAATSIFERQVAGAIRGMTGGEGVAQGEAAIMAYGLISSIRDAFRMSAKALRTGETSWTFNKIDLPQTHALSAEAFGMSKETTVGRFVDFIGNGVRVPTRLLGAEDEFFKTIGYRMEVHAQSLRQALQEGHKGYALGQRIAELVNNPPEHIMINSADAALYNTFTNEMGAFGRAVMNLRNIDHPLNPAIFVIPFLRTPVNIVRYAMERTPFAPLVSQWRADIAAGGARADLALARMSTGTAIMSTVMDLADKGLVTGGGYRSKKDRAIDEAEQRQGMMEYSFKVGDRWYSYNRTDPIGMTLGFAASIAEAVKKGEISQDEVDEWHEVMAMAIAAVSQVVINKTYLEGISNLVEVLSEPKRHSQKYVDDLVASFLPMTSLMSGIKNMADPVQREVGTPAEAVMARIATLSEKLPPRRDLWGKELTSSSGLGPLYDFLSPVQTKKEEPSPVDREMVRLNHGVSRIEKMTSFDGVQANLRFYPEVYDEYVRLAGNELKHPAWNMGAKDYLNAVISGGHPMSPVYNMMSDETRKAFIQSTIGDYRKLAQRKILENPKHTNFKAEVDKLKEYHQRSKMPVME